ncbi:MAG: hypothetical protein IKX55_00940 [Bacteroidaceae bacterium]|nr:hypothetical protein [Bacteroidaceae bacterium]
MEEKKRLTATKAAIAKFREEHPSFTDEYLASSVEKTYPDLYLDNLEVAIEIIKELYRRQEDLNDESFISLLHEMTEGRKLVRYGKEVIKTGEIMAKVRQLLDEIYHDAHEKTVFWSEYPLSKDSDVVQHFEELCKQKGRTLAQQLYAEFNNRALYEAGELSGFILPFHCYSEPNGDVVFTKNRRNKDDYDENGHSMVSEREVANRLSLEENKSSKKSGCLGVIIIGIVLSSLIAFI